MKAVSDPGLRRAAAVLRWVPEEHEGEMPPAFDLTVATCVRKTVPPDVLAANLSIDYGSYLRALVSIDVFCRVVAGDGKALENLKVIQAELAKGNAKAMMTLGLVLVELGLRARELPEDRFAVADVRRRFDARDARPDAATLARGPEPFMLGAASLLLAPLAASTRVHLAAAKSRMDVKAAVFADAAATLGPVPGMDAALGAGDFARAAAAAGLALRGAATRELLEREMAASRGLKHE